MALPRANFLTRLYAGYAALILLLATLAVWFVSEQARSAFVEDVENSLREEAALVRAIVSEHSWDLDLSQYLQSLAEQVASMETRVTVVDKNGKVIADSREDPARMGNHRERPELIAARTTGEGLAVRFSETLRVDMMYFAYPVYDNGDLRGYTRAALPLSAIQNRVARLRNSVLAAAAIAILAALLGGFVFARRTMQPLRSMTDAALAMSEGRYDHAVVTRGGREVEQLSLAFNRMREQLGQHVATTEGDRNQTLAILAAMQEGVVAVDRDERIVHMNHAAGSMLQLKPLECVGQHSWEVFRSTEASELISSTIALGRNLQREVRLTRAVQDEVYELQTTLLQGQGGDPAGAVLVLHDISHLRHLEEVRQDFVSNVSHELKTPVAAIRGLVESILDDPDMDTETERRFLERVSRQCKRLSSLVTDLLSLSALERGNDVPRVPVDLNHLLTEVVDAQASSREDKSLRISVEQQSHELVVLGDSEGLRQVFDNLLSNAIRYTPEEGNIWVRTLTQGNHAVVEVQDTGIGIEPVHQQRIFERFFRADKARSRELGGTGLGLAIVKHIVMRMDGDVTVDSQPGEGSIFRIKLPLA